MNEEKGSGETRLRADMTQKPNKEKGKERMTPSFGRLKISLFSSLLLINTLIVVFLSVSLNNRYRQSVEEAEKRLKNHVIAVRAHTHRIIEGVDLALEQVAEGYYNQWVPRNFTDSVIHTSLSDINKRLPQARAIIILNDTGLSIHDAANFPAQQIDLSDRDYFKAHKNGEEGELYIGRTVKGRTSGRWFLSMSRKISGGGHSLTGVAAAIVDPQYFWEFYDLLGNAYGIETLFYHPDGTVIASTKGLSEDDQGLTGKSIGDLPFYKVFHQSRGNLGEPLMAEGMLLNKGIQWGASLSLDDPQRAFASLRIASFLPEEVVLQAFFRDLRNAVVFLLTILSFTLLLLIITFRQINGRQRTNESLYAAIVERQEAEKKVSEINEELKDLNATLEVKIQDRTHELSTALEDLQSLQYKIIEQEKLAYLGHLVTGVAHEINSPIGTALTAVTALNESLENLEALYNRNSLSEENFHRFLVNMKTGKKLVQTNIERAAELTKSFKEVAADRNISEIREIHLCRYIGDIVNSLSPQLKLAKVSIKQNCPSETLYKINPGALSQVLTNIIMNAVIHGFGSLEVAPLLDIDIRNRTDFIEISVTDNGAGMEEDVKNKIFDPFFTTKRGAGGTGLGMHIVYNIVTGSFHGFVRVESEPQKGTTVTIGLPRSGTAEKGSVIPL